MKPFSTRVAAAVLASVVDTKRDHDCEDCEAKVETKVEDEKNSIGHTLRKSICTHVVLCSNISYQHHY